MKPTTSLPIKELLQDGTLFLDRDGVLNRRLPDDYVKHWGEWEWLPGVLPALVQLAALFPRIVVVTNQRGIARGLMDEDALADIHAHMLADVTQAGGRIDAIYHCPHDKHEGCNCRKPGIGMYLQAKDAFPEIDPARSVLVGDSATDIEMAKAAGMWAVYVGEGSDLADAEVGSLVEFLRVILSRSEAEAKNP
jgi:D-glycero-D-manno-heptose 1,7-bisphosphate phosphatase